MEKLRLALGFGGVLKFENSSGTKTSTENA